MKLGITALFISCLFNSFAHALDSKTIEEQANASIKGLYHTLDSMPNLSMTERINWINSHFLGLTYTLGSLGEGPQARYDQFPRYRVDSFDCDTYVTTVLALALANSLPTFQQCLSAIRYKQGKVSYINRNHFTSIDWNKYNEEKGILQDITLSIKDQNKQPVAVYAEADINQSGWYKLKTKESIRLQKPNPQEEDKRLAELKIKGSHLPTVFSKMPYLPFSALFPDGKNPNLYLFSQIPDGSIIEIIRPNWDLRKEIGTALNVSHLGFAFRKGDEIYFRQASSRYGKVVQVSLVDYLRDAMRSPTIKGINVLMVVPKKPSPVFCEQ